MKERKPQTTLDRLTTLEQPAFASNARGEQMPQMATKAWHGQCGCPRVQPSRQCPQHTRGAAYHVTWQDSH
eukprot:3959372-Amphidinium_carterae.1